MTPRLRRFAPFVLPLVAGAAAYFLVGTGPSSAPVRAGEAARWELPALAAADAAAATPVWKARSPWGSAVEVDAAPKVVARPVGVVEVGDSLFALFSQGDAVVRVAEGGALADGGQVTAIRPGAVEWIDGAGATQRRELLVDVVEAVAADAAATGTRNRPSPRTGSFNGPPPRGTAPPGRGRTREQANPSGPASTRPAPSTREPGQRRARTSVPDTGSGPFNSSRPSTTGD